VRIDLAQEPVQSDTIWLYHKTTHRDVYNSARASRPDCDEVILWNERREITEAGSSNIVVKLDGQWLTPSIESGLLAGTYREWLLKNGRIQSQVITIADLHRAQEIALINSVRRWRKAILIDKDSAI
jgi:para-aminobenzoate synthetase/4-amino-4-deoxychorismate lyase